MVSNLGKAQICNRKLESFTLEKMRVERVIFCGVAWIGFVGQRQGLSEAEEGEQFLEIFS